MENRKGWYMVSDRMSSRARVAIVAASFVLACAVGLVDAASSAYIAFSIFYLIPIFLAAWFGRRVLGILVAVTCALAGFAADSWTLNALDVHGGYAFANLCLRLMLFTLVAVLFSRLHDAMRREQELVTREREAADREREASERLQELNEMQVRLMRSVVTDAREPLGDIYARVVALGFDMHQHNMGDSAEILNEIADASRRLSELVETLQQEDRPSTPEPGVGALS
jgi:K+-sensing histidine kinase KdpD